MGTSAGSVLVLVVACAASALGVDHTAVAIQEGARIVESTDGVPIRFEVHGAGSPTVVFVHGWMCDRGYWDAQVEAFAARHQVVTVDLGGHGDSGMQREAFTIASFGKDVAAAVDEVAAERIVLVGHSMGGDVVVQAARHLRDRTIGLVWVDTYSSLGSPRTTEEIEAIVASLRPEFGASVRELVRGLFPADADPPLVARVANDMARGPQEVGLEAIESSYLHAREVPELLDELDLPVFAINPEGPATDVESLQQHGVEVVLVPGVGHFLMMEDPEGFNRLLKEIIDGIG